MADEAINQAHDPKVYERLDALNDELHIIRRVLNKPAAFPVPESMDMLRLAVDRVHTLYHYLAYQLRGRNV